MTQDLALRIDQSFLVATLVRNNAWLLFKTDLKLWVLSAWRLASFFWQGEIQPCLLLRGCLKVVVLQ